MKHVHIILGGTYFLSDNVGFFDNKSFEKNNKHLTIEKIEAEDVDDMSDLSIKGDAVFVFGVKNWVRKFKKKRYKPKVNADKIVNYLKKNIPSDMPFGMLEDLDLKSSAAIGGRILSNVYKHFNCRLFLLREYVTEDYGKNTYPFAMASKPHLEYRKPVSKKKIDICFRGDNSSDERARVVDIVRRLPDQKKELLVYHGGEKSQHKISFDKYLTSMASSKLCLDVMGNGHSCYRYQEIPSVGSLILSTFSSLVVNNDYEDMKNCIKFRDFKDLSKKMKTVFESKNKIEDMTGSGVDNFLNHHTTEKRFDEFMSYLEKL